MKNLICLILAIIIILTLAACGKTDGERVTNVFSSEEIELPDDFTPDRLCKTANGYALTQSDRTVPMTRIVKLEKSGSKHEVVSDSTIGEYAERAVFLPGGDIVYVSGDSLCRRGEKEMTIALSGLTGRESIMSAAADSEGRLVFATQSSVIVTDDEFNKLFSPELNGSPNGVYSSSDGKVYVCTNSKNTGIVYQTIDIAAKRLGDIIMTPTGYNISAMSFNGGNNGRLWLSNHTGLYAVDSGSSLLLCDFLNSDLIAMRISVIIPEDDDHMAMLYDGRLLTLTRVPDGRVELRKLIKVAGKALPSYLIEGAVEFNRKTPGYRVVVNNYGTGDDADNALRNDIISGNLPDIIMFSGANHRYHEEYINQKLFTDLWKIIDADDTFDKSDLLTGVLKSGERDGKLYEITTTYFFSSQVMKTSNAPSDRLTLRGYLDWAKSLDSQIVWQNNQSGTLYKLLCCSEEEFVDYESGKCFFDSDLFREVLTFAKETPDVKKLLDDEELERYNSNENYVWSADKVLTADVSSDLPGAILQSIWKKFGLSGDITFIGSPDSDGSGVVLTPLTSFAIVEKSEVKDMAWDFLKTMLGHVADDNWGEFSCSRSVMNDIFDDIMKRVYTFDLATGKIGWTRDDGQKPDESRYQTYRVTESDRDKLLDLLENAGSSMKSDSTLWSIIKEESEIYFANAKTLDETVKIIQNRAETYISERN